MADLRSPDYINLPGVLPDTPGSLWGSNTPQTRHNYAQQVPRPQQPDPRPAKPQVLTSFKDMSANGGVSQGGASKVTAEAPVNLERRVIEGATSAVRASRLAHQYRIDFWGDNSALSLLGSASGSTGGTSAGGASGDPSEAALTTAYNDFVLFSYLPPQLMPTAAAFRDMCRPTARTAVVRAALPSMGINGTAAQQELPQTRESTDDPSFLPIVTPAPPYSETLGSLCSNQLFKNKITVRK